MARTLRPAAESARTADSPAARSVHADLHFLHAHLDRVHRRLLGRLLGGEHGVDLRDLEPDAAAVAR
jgi:hypothetical protein